MAELLGLAAACFLAATLIPLPSEGALLVYLHFHPERTALALAVATVANTAGHRPLHSMQAVQAESAVLGPALWRSLCIAAGWLRVHWLWALVFMAAGRLARYLVVALIS